MDAAARTTREGCTTGPWRGRRTVGTITPYDGYEATMTTLNARVGTAIPSTGSLKRWQASIGHALESDRAPLVVGAVGILLVALAGSAAVIEADPTRRGEAAVLALVTAVTVGCALTLRRVPAPIGIGATATMIGVLTAFAGSVFEAAPTVVWLFAYVIPAVGLVRGPAQGAFAGLLSEPALHWIETGTPIDLLDPQAPFGFVILMALGAVPAQLLAIAVARRHALDIQLERARGLLVEAESAREAERAAQEQAVFMLARAAEARDGTTGAHIQSVRNLAGELALAAGVDRARAEEIAWSAMLHDVGKLRVPDRVLLKPGSLTEDEWELIRRHPAWGEELLSGTEAFWLARRIARSHHENWDGTGYPDRLSGGAIPFEARVVRIVDVFDALRSERPYKPSWSLERAIDELRTMRGRGLDPELTDLFLDLASRAPEDGPGPIYDPHADSGEPRQRPPSPRNPAL